MMTDRQQPHYNDLRSAARELASAHAAIVAEIESHSAVEHSKRAARHDQMEANRKLKPGSQDVTSRM